MYKTGLLSEGVEGHRVVGWARGARGGRRGGQGLGGLSDVEDSVEDAEDAPAATLCVNELPDDAAAAAATLESTDERGDAKLVGGCAPPNVRL